MQETKQGIQHVAGTTDPDEIFAILLRDGAVIIEDFLSADQMARLNADLDPHNAAADPLMRNAYDFQFLLPPVDGSDGENRDIVINDITQESFNLMDADAPESFMSGNTRNVTGLSSKSPTFVSEVLMHPTYMAMCDRLLKPHCVDYILNHSHMINVGPHAKGQPLHRDEGVWAGFPGLGVGSHLQFASIVALVDFEEENGATKVVPGSHLWPGDPYGTEGRVPQPEEVVQAVMPAGSAVIYTGWTYHGAGQNRTDDTWRRGLHVSYCQGWLRTEENNTLATPPEVARNLPVRAQELLGYGIHAGLGMLELRNPIDQMRDGVI
jgi:hypothetical protein